MRNYPQFLSRLLLGFLLLFVSHTSFSQLAVSGAMTPAQLVQNILVGNGIAVTNITYTGDPVAIGSFDGSNSNIGLVSGVILTSGDISIAPGPNTSNSSGVNNNYPGDATLTALAGYPTYDAAILEFDFVPIADTVKFRYVFASDEYNEYVCSSVNDVFAFFISGPGITGQQNIALVPGSSTTVSINTVNIGVPGSSKGGTGTNCVYTNKQYFVDNPQSPSSTVEYDGFTTVLTAAAKVVPCQTYHIKIAIADAGDEIYDSGVFLEGGSFVSSNQFLTLSNTDAVEGCTNAAVNFKIKDVLPADTVIHFVIAGTATNGSDYTLLADSIVIKAGDSTGSMPVIPLSDFITEGTETVVITAQQPSPCGGVLPTSVTVNIKDYKTLSVSAGKDTTYCFGDTLALEVMTSGGASPFTYLWNPGSGTGAVFDVAPAVQTVYNVIVTDACAQTATDSVTVDVSVKPVAVAGPDTTICRKDTAQLWSTGGGTYTWTPSSYLSATGISNPKAFPVNSTYYVVKVSNGKCSATDTTFVTVQSLPLADAGINDAVCIGDSVVLGATGGTSYLWTPSTGLSNVAVSNPIAKPTVTTRYYVTVSDGLCKASDSVLVTVKPWPIADAGPDTSVCKSDSIQLSASGGTFYTWTPTATLTDPNVFNPKAFPSSSTTYKVRVANGTCYSEDSLMVNVKPLPVADAGPPVEICIDRPKPLFASGGTSYLWNPASGLSNPYSSMPEASPQTTTVYYVVATKDGCDATDSVLVTVNDCKIYIPNVFSPNSDAVNQYFVIRGIEFYPNSQLLIYNRWGDKVFESANYMNEWDGRHWKTHNRLNDGVYFYILNASDGSNWHGTVTLLREERF